MKKGLNYLGGLSIYDPPRQSVMSSVRHMYYLTVKRNINKAVPTFERAGIFGNNELFQYTSSYYMKENADNAIIIK